MILAGRTLHIVLFVIIFTAAFLDVYDVDNGLNRVTLLYAALKLLYLHNSCAAIFF